MSTARQRERDNRIEQDKQDHLDSLLREQVLHALGVPAGLLHVQVCKLWQGHYRVNVFIGVDVASARVAHSYFVVADRDGNVASATPKITKTY
jgi:hypothetical protein